MVANGSAWRKNNRREWLRTLGRFFAIVAIVALGVGFFTGLRLARPAMAKTGADYIEETNLYDFQLRSTLGFTEEDAAYFAALDGVYQAADYLWPGLGLLPPAVLLALWWGLLTLLRQERG